MEHVVFYPAHDGTPAFRRLSSLEDAVRLVEHLRNVENVSEVSVHSLAEVPLAFKTWYRVEVPAGSPEAERASEPELSEAAELPAPALEVGVQVDVPQLEVPEQPVAVMASAAGPSSLGFFAS